MALKVGDHELKEAGQLEAEKGGKTDSPLEPPERKGTLMTLERRPLRPCRLPTSRPADTKCVSVRGSTKLRVPERVVSPGQCRVAPPAPPAADPLSTVQAAECLGAPEEGVALSTYRAAAGGGDARPATAAARTAARGQQRPPCTDMQGLEWMGVGGLT